MSSYLNAVKAFVRYISRNRALCHSANKLWGFVSKGNDIKIRYCKYMVVHTRHIITSGLFALSIIWTVGWNRFQLRDFSQPFSHFENFNLVPNGVACSAGLKSTLTGTRVEFLDPDGNCIVHLELGQK